MDRAARRLEAEKVLTESVMIQKAIASVVSSEGHRGFVAAVEKLQEQIHE